MELSKSNNIKKFLDTDLAKGFNKQYYFTQNYTLPIFCYVSVKRNYISLQF